MNVIEEIKSGSKWEGKDAFPSTSEWRQEVEDWLLFAKEENQFMRFLPRLRDTPKMRDEALSEICAAYFICRKKNFSIIKWEPQGENNQVGEFVFILPDKNMVFCEVKSPGWEADIAKQDKVSPRLRKPKYIDSDARFYNNASGIRSSIEKAYPKLKRNMPNIVIIVDDFFVSLNHDKFGPDEALYYKQLVAPYSDAKPNGCFVNDDFNKLSALATLNVQQIIEIEYHWKWYKNPFAMSDVQEIV